MPAGGGGVAGKRVSHRGRCSYAEHIGEARTHCRSTRPGCECQPAAAGLPANPFRTEGGAPTQSISEKPEPTVGAPAPGANVSRRRSGRKPGSHRGRCSYTEHIGEARTHRRSTRPGCECQSAAAELPANPFRTEGGAPTRNISEKPEPTVGAPAPGANVSRRRRGCRQTRFAPRAVLLHGVWPGYTGCSRGRRLTP